MTARGWAGRRRTPAWSRKPRVVRRVVQQHELRVFGPAEVYDVDARQVLPQPITVAARVDPEQAAEDETQRRLVRDDQDPLPVVLRDEVAHGRQRAGKDAQARLAARWRMNERVGFVSGVFLGEAPLHV